MTSSATSSLIRKFRHGRLAPLVYNSAPRVVSASVPGVMGAHQQQQQQQFWQRMMSQYHTSSRKGCQAGRLGCRCGSCSNVNNNSGSSSSSRRNVRCSNARHFHFNSALLLKRNPYEVMGLSRNAGKDEVKRKFKELAKKYHPDVCKDEDAKEKFAELNSAYQILSDDNKRRIYDQTGSTEAAYGMDGGGGGGPFGGGGFHSAEDVFNQFFGGGGPFGGPFSDIFGGGGEGGPFGRGRSMQPERGENIRRSVTITLEEVATGAKRDLALDKATPCGTCHGKGKNPKTKPKKCGECDGTGRITVQQMMFVMQTPCHECGGTGRVQDPCPSCRGNGHTIEHKNFELKIPRGSEDSTMLRMSGLGKPGYNGGPPGDLIMEVKVLPHARYRRKGLNLEMDAEVSLAHAVLGGEIQVPTLTGGEATVVIPRGTQHGDTQIAKGFGLTNRQGNRTGDLIVHLKVRIPKELTSEQHKLFEEYAKTEGTHNYGHASSKSWWKSWPFHRSSSSA